MNKVLYRFIKKKNIIIIIIIIIIWLAARKARSARF